LLAQGGRRPAGPVLGHKAGWAIFFAGLVRHGEEGEMGGLHRGWAQSWKGIGIRILNFWWLAWMDSEGYLNLDESIGTFSKIKIWKMIQGFISNEFELKVWNISKFDSKT
jgi:hypothetical protein